jgi:4-phytase/acid phosphatase/peptide/nickel transport system substrate-binding protein
MIHTTTPRGKTLGEVYQQLLRQVGVELELIPVDQTTLVQRVFQNNYMMSGWRIADAGGVGPQLFALSHSESPYNIARMKDPELDKLALAMRTAKSPEDRAKLECELSAWINESGHIGFRTGNRYYIINRPSVEGMMPFTYGTAYVWYMWKESA